MLWTVAVAATETRLRPGDGDNNLMARNYPFFRMNRVDGRIGGWALKLVAHEYEEQEDLELQTPDLQALEVTTATGGKRVSVVGVYHSPGSTQVEDREVFPFLSVVARPASNLMLGGFNATEIDSSCETVLELYLWASNSEVHAREWDGSKRYPSD